MNQTMQHIRGFAWQSGAPRVKAALQLQADRLGVRTNRHRVRQITCANPFDSPSKDSSDDLTWWSQRDELRFEWRWYESRSHPGSWKKEMAADGNRGSFVKESSEVSNGSKGPNPPKDNVDKNNAKGDKGIPKKESGSFSQEPSSHEDMGIDLLQNGIPYRSLPEVYVLIFGERMGLYSLKYYNQVAGKHKETILCFEDAEDAFRYSEKREDTMPFLPTVNTAQTEDLVGFCKKYGYKLLDT